MHFESTELNLMVKVGFPATPTAERTLSCPDLSLFPLLGMKETSTGMICMIYSSEFEDELGHMRREREMNEIVAPRICFCEVH